MSHMLHSLAYFSRISEPVGPEALQAMVGDILCSARRRNPSIGVTGALLFSGGCFAQVLEGELADVELIFETIQCDPRHKDVIVVHFHPIVARSFPEWSMAFAGIDCGERRAALAADALGTPDDIAAAPGGADFVQVLRNLVMRQAELAS